MPLYDYECQSCGKVHEIRHGFNDTVEHPCPECGGELKRKFHAAPIVFKGSGFYVTDSRSSSSTTSAAPSEGKSDAPKVEPPKSDAQKTDSPKGDAPKSEAKKGEAAA